MIKEIAISTDNFTRIVVTNKQQYKELIKKHHGTVNLYETVFQFRYMLNKDRPKYTSAIITRLFFDLDSNNSLENTKKFSDYLLDNNIKHYLVQSSYLRFYVIPLVEDVVLENKKQALNNIMIDLANKSGLTYGNAHTSDLDSTSFGDLARVMAIPGTYKPKRKCWTSFITREDLNNIDVLKERSIKPILKPTFYGEIKLNLKTFDTDAIDYTKSLIDNVKNDFKVEFNDKLVDRLPPFIKKILINYEGYCDNYLNRWRCAVYMREIGYPKSITERICKENFSKHLNYSTLNGNGTQWDRFEKCKGIDEVYKNKRYSFCSISTIKNEGYEITDEDEIVFNKIYYKNV